MSRETWLLSKLAMTTAGSALTASQRLVRDIETNLTANTYAVIDLNDYRHADVLELAGISDGTENDLNTVDIYAGRHANDILHHVGQADFTQGTQTFSATYYYADTIAVTPSDRAFQMISVQNGNNERARLLMSTSGYSYFVFVLTTKAAGTTNFRLNHAVIDEMQGVLKDQNDLTQRSTTGGTQKLTIAANVAVGTDQACRSCLVKWSGTGPVRLQIGATADAADFPLDSTATPVPIDNLNKLNFYSGTNGDIVNIVWRD